MNQITNEELESARLAVRRLRSALLDLELHPEQRDIHQRQIIYALADLEHWLRMNPEEKTIKLSGNTVTIDMERDNE